MYAIVLSLFLSLVSGISVTGISDYSGEWSYKVDSPQGVYEGSVILQKMGDGYDGYIMSGGTKINMEELNIEGNTMTFKVFVDGYPVVISGTFEEETYTAMASVEGMQIPFVARRQ